MSKIVLDARENLKQILIDALLKTAGNDVEIPDFTIETPADTSHGNLATNIAMVSARILKSNPRKIAEDICNNISLEGTLFAKFEIAGPGFINFFYAPSFYSAVLKDIELSGEGYGRSNYGKGERILVEFISANPTGPMHMGNARGGAIGDCLASVLDAAGYYVEREFYVNDAGNQIEKFAQSLDIRYQQLFLGEEKVPLPEDCYQGGDITDLAREVANLNGTGDSLLHLDEKERRKILVDYSLKKNIEKMKKDTQKYRISYDTWFFESILHNNGELKETIEILKNSGLTYEKDGALWYKATSFGGEKDEVLVRANGNPTYFAADIAYHRNKFKMRKFDRCINIWGADHHGHVARLKGAMDAIGLDGSKLDIILMQLVKLMYNGEPIRMSKRTGKAIQLADLLDEVPVDSARFFFNMREANSQMDFDLGLAVQQDSQNPVYYVQYAHARICSIIKTLSAENITFSSPEQEDYLRLTSSEELALIIHLSAYTNEIILSAKNYDSARLLRYVTELATLFHKFYNACKVRGNDPELTNARLGLCICTRSVLRNALDMLKINAPESM